jgi:integrase
MATINYKLNQTGSEFSSLYVRVRIGRAYDGIIKTGIELRPKDWNQNKQAIRDNADNPNKEQQKRRIKELTAHLQNAINEHPEKTEYPKDWLKTTIEKYWNPEKYQTKTVTLFSYIEDFIKQSEQSINPKTGRLVSYRIRRDYIRTFELLKEFSSQQGREYDFNDIDLDWYNIFVSFLQKKNIGTKEDPNHFAANTVGKYIKNLKVFLNSATEHGINTNMRYKSHRFVKIQVETDSVYLNESELSQIQSIDLSNKPHLERVRDLFIVGCWTGLRFGDLSRVKPENIGDGYMRVTQSKTGDKVVIPLHPVVTEIMAKYDGSLPPAISNQKTNLFLKEIAALAGLNESLHINETKGGIKRSVKRQKHELISTHTARRSFATNLYKSGFPSQSIMKITGHKSESAFLRYIKVTPEEHAQLLSKHWSKSVKLKAV